MNKLILLLLLAISTFIFLPAIYTTSYGTNGTQEEKEEENLKKRKRDDGEEELNENKNKKKKKERNLKLNLKLSKSINCEINQDFLGYLSIGESVGEFLYLSVGSPGKKSEGIWIESGSLEEDFRGRGFLAPALAKCRNAIAQLEDKNIEKDMIFVWEVKIINYPMIKSATSEDLKMYFAGVDCNGEFLFTSNPKYNDKIMNIERFKQYTNKMDDRCYEKLLKKVNKEWNKPGDSMSDGLIDVSKKKLTDKGIKTAQDLLDKVLMVVGLKKEN
jgi:hypothetical protein